MNTTSCQFFAMPVLQDDEQQLFNGNRPNNPLCPLYPSIFPKDSIVKPLEGKRRRSVSMSSASHTWVNLSLGFRSTASISSSVSTSSGVDLRFLLMGDFLCLPIFLDLFAAGVICATYVQALIALRFQLIWFDLFEHDSNGFTESAYVAINTSSFLPTLVFLASTCHSVPSYWYLYL